jgi:hypothetical protein
MKGALFVDALLKKFGNINQHELSKRLDKYDAQISSLRNLKQLNPQVVAGIVISLEKQIVRGEELIQLLKAKLKLSTDKELAAALGMSQNAIVNWKTKSRGVTTSQIAGALHKSQKTAIRLSQSRTIAPIVELFPISKVPGGKSYVVFGTTTSPGAKYRTSLKDALEKAQGIYIFHDSRGRALYVGQTTDQNIWKEMNLAFNRHRAVQEVFVVQHPTRNVTFQPAAEKLRQPITKTLKLHQLAAFFSAYDIDPGMIDDLEALLVRTFPNDLLNVKMERFARSTSAGKAKKKSKATKKKHR